ncbi:MAG: NDP-sugar synthase [Vulcanimicrobiota bacterium]
MFMKAIILAGGKGTRLKPYSTVFPKPLMPVGEHPILGVVIKQLVAAGITDITISVNHMADLIMAFFGNGEKFGAKIEYSIENTPLGTVAPVKLVKNLEDHFLVMNGDLLTDINFNELIHCHNASGAKLTIAVYKRDATIDFGIVQIDSQTSQVKGFKEKPTYNYDVSTGVYVYSRILLDRVPDNQPYGMDRLILDMLHDDDPINTYRHNGYWLDIGRPDDYDQANRDVEGILETLVTITN